MILGRWNRNEELYKIMQRNIIVQQWRIKPNGERLDLSIKEQPIKPPNQNRNMFLIRTPFSIILGLLEYSQALQDHADTHHSPSCEEETKVESLTSLRKDKPVKPPIWKMQQLELGNSDLGETNFVGKRTTRATPTKSENMETSGGWFSINFRGATPQHEKPRKSPNSKTQQVIYAKSVFDELELVMEITTSSKTPHG